MLTTHVESKISLVPPDSFVLVFDRQTAPETHYVAVFAIFPTNGQKRFSSAYFGLSPLEDKTTHKAQKYVQFLSFVLELFGKFFENIVGIVGENCNVNCATTNHMDVPPIGCASNCFQLVVKKILYDNEVLLNKVHCLMVKLQAPLIAAKLRKLKSLKAKERNVTCWSSTFEVLRRHVALREFVRQLKDNDR